MLLNIFYSTTNIFTTNDTCPAHLLHPEQLGVAVLVGDLLHDVEGEGADLLDRVDRDLVLQAPVPPLFDQIVVNLKIFSIYTINIFFSLLTPYLPCAEQHLAHIGWAFGGRSLQTTEIIRSCIVQKYYSPIANVQCYFRP